MRPRTLTVSAFGPFGGREVIDFTKLDGRDLLLIEGPTGAGKTSILDAICYALFGTVPGARSQSRSELRSAFADPSLGCEVSFEFDLRGRTYRVQRSPEQERSKKRSTGTTIQQAEAHLFEVTTGGEKPLASKLTEVDAHVKEILGLDERQFVQVLLLPQGEFRKFLLASSKDKEDLLEHLFKTSTYRAVADYLGEQKRELQREAGELVRLRDDTLAQREVDSVAALDARIEALKNELVLLAARAEEQEIVARAAQAAHIEATQVDALHRALERARAQAKTIDTERSAIDVQRRAIARAVEAEALSALLERAAIARKEYGLATTDLGQRTRELALAETAANHASVGASGLPVLAKKLEALQLERGRLEPLRETEAEVGVADEIFREAKGRADDARAVANARRTEFERARSALDTHDRTASDTRGLARGAADHALDAERARVAFDRGRERAETQKKLQECERALENGKREQLESARALVEAKRELEDARRARETNLAAELAANLDDGAPCPVCGSTEHPAKASAPPASLRGKHLEDRTRAFESAQSRANELDVRTAKLEAELAHLREKLSVDQDEAAAPDEATVRAIARRAEEAGRAEKRALELDALRPTLLEAVEACGRAHALADEHARKIEGETTQAYDRLEHRREALRKAGGEGSIAERLARCVGWVEATVTEIARLEEAQRNATSRLETARELLADRKAKAEIARTTLDRAIASLEGAAKERGFVSAEDAESARLASSEVEQIRRTLEEFVARDAACKQEIDRLAAETANRPRSDVEALGEMAEVAARAARVAIDAHGSSKSLLVELEKARKLVTERDERYQRIEKQLRVLGRLATVVSGENQLNMSLQRFVLASRMDEVALAASQRLHRMSRGRYRLLRTDDVRHRGRGSGLDLAVEDAHTGTTRSVHSLSGGEMFLASLSLALGLADVVTRRSGGVHLDTLFIDEGFGSLDDETLDLVMRALEDLREGGRLVGMISHVSELKERIPTRLVVNKGERGSTTSWRL